MHISISVICQDRNDPVREGSSNESAHVEPQSHVWLAPTPHLGRLPAKLACADADQCPCGEPGLEHEQIKAPLPAPTSRFCPLFLCAGDIKNVQAVGSGHLSRLVMYRNLPIPDRGAVADTSPAAFDDDARHWRFTSGEFRPCAGEAQPTSYEAGSRIAVRACPPEVLHVSPNLATPPSPIAPVRCVTSYCRFRPWGFEPRGPLSFAAGTVTALFWDSLVP